VDGAVDFPLTSHFEFADGLPYLNWQKVHEWVGELPATHQGEAWSRCERAWLLHLGAALGPEYRLTESDSVALLSTLEPRTARNAMNFVSKTLRGIVHALDGIAHVPEWGKDVLVVLDSDEDYYRYISHYYPEEGEFARSSGIYIGAGCAHFVTVKTNMTAIEPVIAHEMTHSCVGHLRLPAWLNEGMAVNMENRLTGSGVPIHTPREMHEKHLQFWGIVEMQEFWSGKSFLRSDDGNMLSYDLARIMVEQMATNWPSFKAFVLDADFADSGAKAAEEHLGVDLGAYTAAILEKEEPGVWGPDPNKWDTTPERGGFRSPCVD
jgi:hypothetical protein